MRVLVTGATGFVGRALVPVLLERGDDVVAVVRPSRPEPAGMKDRVRIFRADLRAPSGLAGALEGVDAIVHLAAGTAGNWRATFDINVTATEHLLAAVREAGWQGRFVHASSFSVYGLNQLPAGSEVTDTTPLEPEPGRRDEYAWCKLLQERLVSRLAGTPGIELAIVRPGAIHGPGRAFQYRLGRMLGSTLILFGGRNLMPLNYVENTASLLAECVAHPAAAGEVFNAVDRDPVTQLAYVRRWRACGTGPEHVVPVPLSLLRGAGAALVAARERTDGRISPPLALDPYVATPTLGRFRYPPSRAEDVLGWRQPVDRDEALRRTFA
jgi:nucleoside-diphosphate-sugar epimerase